MKTRGCRIMALLTNDKHIWVELLNITKSLAQLNWDRKMLLFSRDLLASCALPFHSSFFSIWLFQLNLTKSLKPCDCKISTATKKINVRGGGEWGGKNWCKICEKWSKLAI